jgi:Fur family ferric uptake transcriptional regulator
LACYESYVRELRELGYRLTPQRVLVLDALFHHGDHMTVDEIYEYVHVRNERVNRSTVYRSLHFLTAQGLVTVLERGSGETLYAAVKEAPHMHAVCQRCGAVLHVEAALLQSITATIRELNGFEVMVGNVQLPGLCHACAQHSATEET